jgi:hypothetical protein
VLSLRISGGVLLLPPYRFTASCLISTKNNYLTSYHRKSVSVRTVNANEIYVIEQIVFVDKVWEMEFANISSSAMCSAVSLEVLIKIK